eukprot:s2730_g5.t1
MVAPAEFGLKWMESEPTEVLQAAKGWQEALRSIRRRYAERHGDHFQQLQDGCFAGLVDPAVVARAKEVALWGVKANAELTERKRVRSAPHPSLREHLDEAARAEEL